MVEPIREKVFRRWCNSFLLPVNMCMEDFSLDLKDGVKLCALLEIVSGRSVPGFTKTPDRREQVRTRSPCTPRRTYVSIDVNGKR